MRRLPILPRLGAAALVAFSLLAPPAHAAQTCAINTGLNPACPLTSAGVVISGDTLSGAATTNATDLFGTYAWGAGNQLALSEPVYEHLHIDGVGDAYGLGDVKLGYTRAFDSTKRLTQFAGLSASFPSGAPTFSTGVSQLAPVYGFSYALGARIALVADGQYAFDAGGTKQPFAPRIEALTVVPRAIVNLSRTGAYGSLSLQGTSVTGDQRYQAYRAGASLGIVLHQHFNLSLSLDEPAALYTREQVFFRAIGLRVSWQR